jgi:hypothetical protein
MVPVRRLVEVGYLRQKSTICRRTATVMRLQRVVMRGKN